MRERPISRVSTAGAIAFALAAACARTAEVEPPATLPPEAVGPAAIDSALVIRDISVLAHDSMQGRAVATSGSAKARTFLEARFRAVGLQPFGTSYLQPFTFSDRGRRVEGVNIVGFV